MTTLFARRAFLLGILCLAFLAGCSRSTVFTIDIDVLSFMDEETERSETLPFDDIDLRLPDDDGFADSEIGLPAGAIEGLERFETVVSGTLTLEDAPTPGDITLALHVASSAEGDPFLTPPVEEVAITIAPGETVSFDFDVAISETENAATLDTLRSGDFRIGVHLESVTGGADDGDITYVLDAFDLSVSASADGLFSF